VRNRPPRLEGKFIRPLPEAWIRAAAALPGKALHVGCALWFLAGLRQSESVIVPNGLLKEYGVGRGAKRRCLQTLQAAGLITIEPRPNRNPQITLVVPQTIPNTSPEAPRV
jgi:hypothetical protein